MKLLPYPEKPIFLCYHNKAFPFGIIEANSPESITNGCAQNVSIASIIRILLIINLILLYGIIGE